MTRLRSHPGRILKADTSVCTHAERQGLFVIRATGKSATITNEPDFRPRAFA